MLGLCVRDRIARLPLECPYRCSQCYQEMAYSNVDGVDAIWSRFMLVPASQMPADKETLEEKNVHLVWDLTKDTQLTVNHSPEMHLFIS